MTGVFVVTPLVLCGYVLVFIFLSLGMRRAADNTEGGARESEPYACGQRGVRHFVTPDYYTIFAYAFFFTVMHVLVLVVATAPYDAPLLPIAYIIAGAMAMIMLFKWDK